MVRKQTGFLHINFRIRTFEKPMEIIQITFHTNNIKKSVLLTTAEQKQTKSDVNAGLFNDKYTRVGSRIEKKSEKVFFVVEKKFFFSNETEIRLIKLDEF